MSSDNVLKDDDTVGEKARSVSRGREAFVSFLLECIRLEHLRASFDDRFVTLFSL